MTKFETDKMTKVRCNNCGYVINVSRKAEEMISIKNNNPKISFHPSYYNQCPKCGCREVTMNEEDGIVYQSEQDLVGSLYRLYCPDCGKYTYFKYSSKGKREDENTTKHITNPFNTVQCAYCGNKQCIISEKVGEKYE